MRKERECVCVCETGGGVVGWGGGVGGGGQLVVERPREWKKETREREMSMRREGK